MLGVGAKVLFLCSFNASVAQHPLGTAKDKPGEPCSCFIKIST